MAPSDTFQNSTSVVDILDYRGHVFDIAINWALIVVTYVSVALASRSGGVSRLFDFICHLWNWAFQVVLCLIVGCTGVSIVWSANVGYAFAITHMLGGGLDRQPLDFVVWLWMSSTCALAAWIYYAVTSDLITTVAHAAALVMGLLEGALAYWLGATQPALRPSESGLEATELTSGPMLDVA